MKTPAQINTDQRNGNLHINVVGVFTPNTAAILTTIMAKTYRGKGNIFIHTSKVTSTTLESSYAFNNLLDLTNLPRDNVYLTGEKGLEISQNTTKVIFHKKKKHGHGGCGRCKNCSCHTRKAA